MANVIWQPPDGWTEENGARVQFTTPCNCSAASALVIGENTYQLLDATGVAISSYGGGIFSQGALLEFILDVTNKKAYLLNQGGLKNTKLLWSGSLTSGSITVPGFSDYDIFAVEFYASLVLAKVSSSGYLSVGEFDISTGYAGWGTLSGAVLSVDGDTLTLLHNFYVSVHDTNWYQSAADQTNTAITAIYGLSRK